VVKFHSSDEEYSFYPAAGFFIRLCSSLLDGIIMGVSQKAVYAFIIFLADIKKSKGWVIGIPYAWETISLVLLLLPSYLIILRSLKKYGYTPAKKILGLKVIRDDFSTNLSWGQLIFREFFAKIISVILFPISLSSIFFRKDRRTLHDFLCSTRVVKISENS